MRKLVLVILFWLTFVLGQSQCKAGTGIESIISRDLFNQMLKYHNTHKCPKRGFYTYKAFIMAARSFRAFGTTGGVETRKREIAAFLGQTSQQTTGGWLTAPDGPYAWGYCTITKNDTSGGNFCDSPHWPCPAGREYYGRGPMRLTYNFNYGQAGKAIGQDLINNPDLVETNAVISFKTAIWFWMTPQGNKPSCHDVMTGRWTPSAADRAAGRVPGYGVITNIIDGSECGWGANQEVADRIGFFQRYCDMLGVSYGKNLDCYFQQRF
ncbi:OLC1v1001403C1 [Oldenlandia corymbosa var. corymbosa]|uniref:chitinase n=1 Tax=Oldenlandia corymbosa var. corymbosa TaxID=529605 RepID=A0AAV1D6T7_OLDCO|nr:OLC1v1001403C1 [Oldenlandia corymbosa var. corymbosa]